MYLSSRTSFNYSALASGRLLSDDVPQLCLFSVEFSCCSLSCSRLCRSPILPRVGNGRLLRTASSSSHGRHWTGLQAKRATGSSAQAQGQSADAAASAAGSLARMVPAASSSGSANCAQCSSTARSTSSLRVWTPCECLRGEMVISINHNLKVFRGGKLVLTSLYMVKGFGLAGCCQPLGQLLPPAADVPQHRLPGLHQQPLTTYFICCCCCAGVPAEGPGYFLWRAHGC